jgi:hypothetical protein
MSFNDDNFGDMNPEALDQILVAILVASLGIQRPSDQSYRLSGVISTMEYPRPLNSHSKHSSPPRLSPVLFLGH